MRFEFGDIVLVNYPFTSHAAFKKRPAVVVSSVGYNVGRPDVIVLPITSQMRSSAALGEVWITDWQSASLLKPSAIKPVFMTMEQLLVIRSLGRLAGKEMEDLRGAMTSVLG